MADSSENEDVRPSISNSSKKRRRTGRMNTVLKKMKVQSHEVGEDCQCKFFKCFEKIAQKERSDNIKMFNMMEDWNEQSSHLTSLISLTPIMRRRSRKEENDAQFRDCNYNYRIRVKRESEMVEIPVCRNAFISLHGISRRRLMTIQKSLKLTGQSPKDKQGLHGKHPWKLNDETSNAIIDHINSFKGRSSHYSTSKKTASRIYLPEDLSIKRMYEMYTEKHPNLPVSYETYRTIFNDKFNISFGYPRCDTCSTCDKFQAEMKILNVKLSNTSCASVKADIIQKIKLLEVENNVHKLKADTFYSRKKSARQRSRKSLEVEAICMDFQRNLSLPNISTNDVYYRRQLSYYSFNIHQLSNGQSVFFTYTEDVGKKGSNEVTSFLHHYVMEILDKKVKHLEIFCDSCGGQNKNFIVFKYLHHLVHTVKRFDSIKITFPIRGHSYLECDKNMGLINTKSAAEMPDDWNRVIEGARCKPSPFKVIEVDQSFIRDWSSFLEAHYLKKCPFMTRPIKEARVTTEHPRFFFHRETYNGAWVTSVVTNPRRHTKEQHQTCASSEFLFPDRAYTGKLKISQEKYRDLQVLKQFCREEARKFYSELQF